MHHSFALFVLLYALISMHWQARLQYYIAGVDATALYWRWLLVQHCSDYKSARTSCCVHFKPALLKRSPNGTSVVPWKPLHEIMQVLFDSHIWWHKRGQERRSENTITSATTIHGKHLIASPPLNKCSPIPLHHGEQTKLWLTSPFHLCSFRYRTFPLFSTF